MYLMRNYAIDMQTYPPEQVSEMRIALHDVYHNLNDEKMMDCCIKLPENPTLCLSSNLRGKVLEFYDVPTVVVWPNEIFLHGDMMRNSAIKVYSKSIECYLMLYHSILYQDLESIDRCLEKIKNEPRLALCTRLDKYLLKIDGIGAHNTHPGDLFAYIAICLDNKSICNKLENCPPLN